MSKKLSTGDMKTLDIALKKFAAIAPGFKIEFDKLKDERYIHILRNGKIIGCFLKDDDNDPAFEFHRSYKGNPSARKIVKLKGLKDDDIKDAILRTRGHKPRCRKKTCL